MLGFKEGKEKNRRERKRGGEEKWKREEREARGILSPTVLEARVLLPPPARQGV